MTDRDALSTPRSWRIPVFKVALGVLLAAMLVAWPHTGALAQTDEAPGTASTCNSDLVDEVEQGCVYIWAMGPGDTGFMQPLWIGSGVIFMAVPEEEAAYALTNHHVASETSMLQVETWDRNTYKAQLVATEPGIDCALIRIENIPRDRYEPCVLGNSDNVQIGEQALAVGAPGSAEAANTDRSNPLISFGLHQTATMRVVSGRQTDPYSLVGTWASWKYNLGRQVMTNCPWRFVTEAAISGGNSGGPLFNMDGEVIGLNHAGYVTGPQLAQHVNLTIPINFCKNFAFQILDTGKYELPWFGMDVLLPPTFDDGMAVTEFVERYHDPDNLVVYGVRKDSPAERAGLKPGDVILEFDGHTFANVTELRLYVFTLDIGKQVPVLVKRGKREIDLTMDVGVKRGYDSEFSL